jgi:hypothetical protein
MENMEFHKEQVKKYDQLFLKQEYIEESKVGRPKNSGKDELKLVSIRLRLKDISFIEKFEGRGLGTKIRSLISRLKGFEEQRKQQCEFIKVYLNQFTSCYEKYKKLVMRKDSQSASELERDLAGLETLIKHSLKTLRLKNIDELEEFFEPLQFQLINSLWIK